MFESLITAWQSIDNMPVFLYASAMVIFNLVMIEGLLSADNALGIAAMASHLPEHQQKPALRWGLVGAYFFRGVALVMVAWLMHNVWVKWFGALYLVYLACEHLRLHPVVRQSKSTELVKGKSLLMTILSIELMDLSLSLDNVIAAVGMVNGVEEIPEALHIWVVCIGVFIGIAALRVVAGWCIGIIHQHPVLKHTAFLLVGFVGIALCAELGLEEAGIEWQMGIVFKFSVICAIIAASLCYERSRALQELLRPAVLVFRLFCADVADFLSLPFLLLKKRFNQS